MKHSWNDTDGERLKYSHKPIILKKIMQIHRGNKMLRFTLSLTLALDRGGWSMP